MYDGCHINLIYVCATRTRHRTGCVIHARGMHCGGLHLVLLQCCVLAPPELKRIRKVEQLLLFCYILAVFHIVTVYVSVVISNLSTVRYASTLDTLQDLSSRLCWWFPLIAITIARCVFGGLARSLAQDGRRRCV